MTAVDPLSKPLNQPGERRRQVRKGTRSCWECRRRKIRCLFDDAVSADVCRGCRRRGAACVGQDYTEETSRKKQHRVGRDAAAADRLERLESLVGHMLGGRGASQHPTPSDSSLTPDEHHAEETSAVGTFSRDGMS